MNVIADTGLLVALVAERDHYHDWAVELARRITWPVLTCEAVLAETTFHLQSSKAVTGMLLDNLVRVAFDCSSHLEHLHELAVRYGDRKPDLADLCLVRMSELYPRHPVVTIDRDFRVYRRYRREIIPTLCPPN
ncbi:MAG: pilus assembly protein [Acidobacteria bacterium]|nr:MAG: pilus assembly protein [Acidobacteriota bacterium]